MNMVVAVLLRLLRLPVKRRLALALGALVVSLGLYGLAFPATYLSGMLMLPLVLSAWLFGWQGGLLCVAGISLILGAGYGVTFGGTFWSPVWFVPFVTGTLCGLAVCLTVGVMRCMADALLVAQHKIARTEQAYQQEHALNEFKEQVLQNLSHELRTPLTHILGYLDLLETYQDQFDAATQARFIIYARSGCEELLSLIATALDPAHASGVQQSLHLSIFSLQHEVQTVMAHLEPGFLQDYRFELDISESVRVYTDPRFVRQVVRNLLTNACKYTPPQTRITVSATPWLPKDGQQAHTNMICVRVSDEGPGIPPEQQPLLFQRFVRLPNAAASTQPGTGLGLAICKQLVEAMGGSIWVESTGQKGEGCCFSFTLASGSAAGAEDQMKREGGSNDQAKEIPLEKHEQRAVSSFRRGS
jgi:signal transduction histidine kinase